MANNIKIKMKIKSLYYDMTQTEKLISDYVIDNFKNISTMSINKLSEELGLAPSTIYQYTKKLEFKGFKDFKIAILTDGFNSQIAIHEKVTKDDDELTIAKSVFDSSIRSLEDTKNFLDIEKLKSAKNLLVSSSKTLFVGQGGSNAVAFDAYHKFLRSPLQVLYATDYHVQLMNTSLLTTDDCVFLVSHTGLNSEILKLATLAKNNGTKIILLTSYPSSPLAKLADIVLLSISEETKYRSESLSSRISQLAIIDSLFVITMLDNEQESQESLKAIRNSISLTRI
jgi:DNA-binding MurR/RpiR family transcriptional regulator